jgi:hypothetical protein
VLRALVGELADEALVSVRTIYYALRAARDLGLIREGGGLIRIVSPEWQDFHSRFRNCHLSSRSMMACVRKYLLQHVRQTLTGNPAGPVR